MTMLGRIQDPDPVDDRSRRKNVLAVALALLLVVQLAVLGVLVAPAAAQPSPTPTPSNISKQAGYYNNSTETVDDTAWFAGLENASMDDIITMAMRLGPYIIGTGSPTAGGFTGVLLLGLVVVAVFMGAIAGAGIGLAGAAVAALTVGYGMVAVGLAPGWIRVVLLFLLGLVVAVVVRRGYQ